MSGTPLIQRAAPFFTAWIRRNHRLLSSSSSSALPETYSSASSSPADDVIHLTDSTVMRMKELQTSEGKTEELLLRLGVETGGCSGFQYVFDFDSKVKPDDRVFEEGGVKLVVDNISYDFVKGATVDYVKELIRSAFVVGNGLQNAWLVHLCSPDILRSAFTWMTTSNGTKLEQLYGDFKSKCSGWVQLQKFIHGETVTFGSHSTGHQHK